MRILDLACWTIRSDCFWGIFLITSFTLFFFFLMILAWSICCIMVQVLQPWINSFRHQYSSGVSYTQISYVRSVYLSSSRISVLVNKNLDICWTGLHNALDSRGLSNTISESDDWFLLLSSQESLFGDWPSHSLEAISCHDRQLLQWALAKSRKWFVFSNSDRGSEIAYFSTEPRHPVNPKQRRDKWMCWWPDRNKTCKIWTDRLSVWPKTETRTECYENSLWMSLGNFFFSEDIDKELYIETQWPQWDSQKPLLLGPKIL